MENRASDMSLNHEHNVSGEYGTVLLHWQEPEHEPFEVGPRSRIVIIVLLILIIAYALFTNSPLMAITFILIGMVGYLSLGRKPEILSFYVTSKGVIAGKEFYPYESIQSFHIYTEHPFENLLSLHTNGHLVSHVHVPTVTININTLREALLPYVPEAKHEPSLVDTMERLLHI